MRNIKRHLKAIAALWFVFSIGFCNAQEQTQHRVRIKADYFKVMNQGSHIELSTSARINKKTVGIPGLELEVYNINDEEDNALGTVMTDLDGKGRIDLGEITKYAIDSNAYYNFSIRFKGIDSFKRANRDISIKDAAISAKHVVRDSVDYLEATLKDMARDSTIAGVSLDIQVRRLFAPLKLGEEFNTTDGSGTVLVPIESGIPGKDGNLILEAVLNDNDDYGNVMAIVEAAVGIPIVEDTSFDERALWGPRGKTPIFILVFTYTLILGILGIIIYLVMNLFRIKNAQ